MCSRGWAEELLDRDRDLRTINGVPVVCLSREFSRGLDREGVRGRVLGRSKYY